MLQQMSSPPYRITIGDAAQREELSSRAPRKRRGVRDESASSERSARPVYAKPALQYEAELESPQVPQ